MSKQRLLTIGTLAALCAMLAFSMHARAAGQEGMVVVRDPQTGKMRAPTPDELKELRAKTPSTAGMQAPRETGVVERRDGARGVRLGEKTMVYDVVTRGADGKLTSRCIQDGAGADHALDHSGTGADQHSNHGENTDESR